MKQQPLQPQEKQPHQPQTQPQITLEATATPTAKETSKKVPKFSRLFKLSRSPLKVIQESNRRSKSADSRSQTTSTKNGGLSVVGQPQSTKVRFHEILSGEKLKIIKNK